MSLVLGIPASILSLVQDNLLEREFHDALYPNLLYRGESMWEEWPEHAGTQLVITRRGLLTPSTKPLAAGADPIPQTLSYEQFTANLDRYAWTVDTFMPTSAVSMADEFMSNVQALGLQAGQSVNRLARNALFKAYVQGHTVLTAATATTDTSISVASLNGFREVVLRGTTTRPSPVSPATPLPITINATISRNVIAASPADPADPDGPGVLQLDAAVGAIVAARAAVLSAFRPTIIRPGGGASVDALTGSSILTLQNLITAVSILRKNNVRPHEDGNYHVHMSQDANTQIFDDPVWQRTAGQSLPKGDYYQEAFVGRMSAFQAYANNESPELGNTGATTATSANALYAEDIGAEVVNHASVKIARTIVTGRGALIEKGLDQDAYLTEAGVTGKVGDFNVVSNGIQIGTDRIRLIVRAPINRTQDKVAATGMITTSFTPPSDIAAGAPSRYKRAVVIEHAVTLS